MQSSSVAVEAAIRRHYVGNPLGRSHVIEPRPPIVVRAGPAFAFVFPTQHVVHLSEPVAQGTEFVLVVVVLVVVAQRVLPRLVTQRIPWPGRS